MKPLWHLMGGVSTAMLTCLSTSSFAQSTLTWKLQCLAVGDGGPLEPLGDRDGHALSVSDYICRAEGGPLDGAVFTGNSTWEWDKGSAELRGGSGVYRKPGAMAMHDRGEGKLSLTMADGKVTGWTSVHHGTYNVATGGAAALAGKKWSAVGRSSGEHQFTVDVKVE